VESRTHWILMSGLAFSNALLERGLVGLDLVGFERGVDRQRGLGGGGAHHARQGGGQCKQLVAIHEVLRW